MEKDGPSYKNKIFRSKKNTPSWEDRIRDRLSRDSSASVRSPPGLPTGLSSAACGVWCVVVFFRALLLLRLFLFLLFSALCVRVGESLSSLSSFIHFFRFFLSSRKLTAANVCTRRWYSHSCEQVKPSPKSAKKH